VRWSSDTHVHTKTSTPFGKEHGLMHLSMKHTRLKHNIQLYSDEREAGWKAEGSAQGKGAAEAMLVEEAPLLPLGDALADNEKSGTARGYRLP